MTMENLFGLESDILHTCLWTKQDRRVSRNALFHWGWFQMPTAR